MGGSSGGVAAFKSKGYHYRFLFAKGGTLWAAG